ncbi:MAG: flagellar basal body P-ring formation protein FlgA [Granulosicoccus sp.]|nr:flagellar basal body P-ring formation protein FlgA [Granulosicoccus sp.]
MKLIILTLIALCSSTIAHAQPDIAVQSLDELQQAVVEFILSEQSVPDAVSIDVKSLDRRLRLRDCEEPLHTRWSSGSRTLGRVTVLVSCPGPVPWRVHTQATVSVEGHVWSLRRAVQSGDVLDDSLLIRKKVVLGGNNRVLSLGGPAILDKNAWLGYVFTQRVGAGAVLTERMLKRANLISRGEKVIIRHQSTGLQLQTKGIALENGVNAQRLQVKNSSSGKIVDAIVVGRGIVEVLK